MTKEDMLRLMSEKIKMLEPFLAEAGIREGYLQVPEKSNKLKITFIRPGYRWLLAIETGPVKTLKDVKKSLPEKVWARYKLWDDFHNHNEMIHLKRALNDLRTTVISRNRPDYFKRGKITQAIKATEKSKKNKTAKNRSVSRVSRTTASDDKQSST